ncbi:MAG: hypothetical protein U0441_37375 [Polyangiaceae bacterium]
MILSKTSLLALLSTGLFVASVAGCDSDTSGSGGSTGGSTTTTSSGGSTGGMGGSTGGSTGGATGGTTSSGMDFSTSDKILAYLNGKTLVMEGADIPTDPNGFNENVNFGSATQCYSKVTMTPTDAAWHVASDLGTLNNAPNKGDVGMCDHATVSTMVAFDSTAILIENVTADCFDFTATYVGFSQEGRGKIAADGSSLDLELFFGGQATGHRCADGAVGAMTVKLNGADFKGDAVQTYQVSAM